MLLDFPEECGERNKEMSRLGGDGKNQVIEQRTDKRVPLQDYTNGRELLGYMDEKGTQKSMKGKWNLDTKVDKKKKEEIECHRMWNKRVRSTCYL